MVSVRRVAPVLLLAAMPVFGAARKATSSSHPPRQLHRVGDHWTAYNPPDPATYPPSAKTYAIKQGDTLWGLAKQFFNNPYLWPQLWESNTWITDAHWIYPGDVLLVEGEAAQAAANTSSAGTASTAGGTAGTAGAAGTAGGGTTPMSADQVALPGAAAVTSVPVPLGTEYDVYCFGYIGDPNEPMPNNIGAYEDTEAFYEVGAVRQEVGGSYGDLIYLNGGTSTGLLAGETYLIVEPGEMILHPVTKEPIGRDWTYRGQVRVLCADDHQARGIITESCMDIHVGARLKPLPQIPIPLARIPGIPTVCDPASNKNQGYIVAAEGGWLNSLGDGLLVHVNLGRDDQVQPGDFLTVWRDSPEPGQPRQVLGEVGILTTEARTATAKIVATRFHLQIGDHVERQ